ncbi:Cell growth regulator with EF hand domain protein 1 [Liparis tanakae]|uniref:Cell growth regulator with EF hand domain protein 1 n=1 Tax=Liparis tanakae TaxID=230148 RepID=A0A4Z2H5P0_9TELE|nr:Cell growth regulator with EF hand domain protein 1 [Liparis tanakae]
MESHLDRLVPCVLSLYLLMHVSQAAPGLTQREGSVDVVALADPFSSGDRGLLQSYIQSSLKDGEGGPEISTREQEVFFLFGLHDYDRSGLLDGLEMMKLLSDYNSHHTPGAQSNELVVSMVDSLLQNQDANRDGLLAPSELLSPALPHTPDSSNNDAAHQEAAAEEQLSNPGPDEEQEGEKKEEEQAVVDEQHGRDIPEHAPEPKVPVHQGQPEIPTGTRHVVSASHRRPTGRPPLDLQHQAGSGDVVPSSRRLVHLGAHQHRGHADLLTGRVSCSGMRWLPSVRLTEKESSMISRALLGSMSSEPHTWRLAVSEALAVADMVFFHWEPRVTIMAWKASVWTWSRVSGLDGAPRASRSPLTLAERWFTMRTVATRGLGSDSTVMLEPLSRLSRLGSSCSFIPRESAWGKPSPDD